jgi:hypothetical protein
MISYRANLFDSLNKQINPYKSGDLFKAIDFFNINGMIDKRGRNVNKNDIFILSHKIGNKCVMQRQDCEGCVVLFDKKQIDEHFKLYKHEDFGQFSIGQKVCPRDLSDRRAGEARYIIRFGLTGELEPKAYLAWSPSENTADAGDYKLIDLRIIE